MPNQDNAKYRQDMNRLSYSTSLEIIKTLYQLADLSLMSLSSNMDTSKQEQKLEKQLLEDKDTLILLAAEIKCQNHQDISQKVDLLHTAFLEEKTESEFCPTDVLLKSIWEYHGIQT